MKIRYGSTCCNACHSFHRNRVGAWLHWLSLRLRGRVMKIQHLEPGASVVEIELGPNDVLVLTSDAVLRPEQRMVLRERIELALKTRESCLVLDGGIRASVLKRPSAQA